MALSAKEQLASDVPRLWANAQDHAAILDVIMRCDELTCRAYLAVPEATRKDILELAVVNGRPLGSATFKQSQDNLVRMLEHLQASHQKAQLSHQADILELQKRQEAATQDIKDSHQADIQRLQDQLNDVKAGKLPKPSRAVIIAVLLMLIAVGSAFGDFYASGKEHFPYATMATSLLKAVPWLAACLPTPWAANAYHWLSKEHFTRFPMLQHARPPRLAMPPLL